MEYCEYFDELTYEQAGQAIKTICDYVREKPLDTSDLDSGTKIVVKTLKQDIDKAFKKYRAQCENGKKGGVPKGNKNAAKNKKKYPEFDEISGRLAWRIVDFIYRESEQQDFDIDIYLTKKQIADLAVCYELLDIESIDDYELEYSTIKEYVLNESASRLCRKLKEQAKCEYGQKNNNKTFSECFADYKEKSLDVLKLSTISEISRFSDMCDAILEDFYSNDELKEKFTAAEPSVIQEERAKNNPKTTQNNQILN